MAIDRLYWWSHKILPLIYDSSLSYYEFLCKVIAKLNDVIDATNTVTDTVEEIVSEYVDTAVPDAVDDYLKTLPMDSTIAQRSVSSFFVSMLKEKTNAALQEVVDSGLYKYIYIDADMTFTAPVTVNTNYMQIIGAGGKITSESEVVFKSIGTFTDNAVTITGSYTVGNNKLIGDWESVERGEYLYILGDQELTTPGADWFGSSASEKTANELRFRLGTYTGSGSKCYGGGIYKVVSKAYDSALNTYPIVVSPCFDWYVGNVSSCVKVVPVVGVEYKNLNIEVNNTTVENYGGVIYLNGCIDCKCENNTIYIRTGRAFDCIMCYNVNVTGNAVDSGAIDDTGYTCNLVHMSSCRNCLIDSNTLTNGTQCVDITVYTNGYPSSDIKVTNNVITPTYTGITTHPGTHHVYVGGNIINNRETRNMGWGNNITSNGIGMRGQWHTVENNKIDVNGSYAIGFAEGWARNFKCIGNEVMLATYGVYISESATDTRDCSFATYLIGEIANNKFYRVTHLIGIDRADTSTTTASVSLSLNIHDNIIHLFYGTSNNGFIFTVRSTNKQVKDIFFHNNTYIGSSAYMSHCLSPVQNLQWHNNNLITTSAAAVFNYFNEYATTNVAVLGWFDGDNSTFAADKLVYKYDNYNVLPRTAETTQNRPLLNPYCGQTVYDRTTGTFLVYDGSAWRTITIS